MFKGTKKEVLWGNQLLELETGKLARQSTSAVTARMGGTIVLCTVVAAKAPKEGVDFFPLTVHYQERLYAAGTIPGGYTRREAKPTDREVLISRLIDRPIRPLFPEGFLNEVQIICTLLSYDPLYQPDVVAIAGTSAALAISGVPFLSPIAAARVGYRGGEYILNPSMAEVIEKSDLDLVVAGTDSSVLMVESEAKELSEEVMLGAVNFGHQQMQPVIEIINEMAREIGNVKWEVPVQDDTQIMDQIKDIAEAKIREAYKEQQKQLRNAKLDKVKAEVEKQLVEGENGLEKLKVNYLFKELQKEIVRHQILFERIRIDGRDESGVRQIETEVDLLPNTHGSALFTRGETQALVVTTLGTGEDEQMIDDLEGDRKVRFMLHYNFPPYSVGEVGRLGAPGRREIGHGKLAFKAINPLLPTKEEFPYTLRVVSEITESNGSSSMATVCGTSLSLMAAGVPLRSPVGGIAMGLIKEGDKFIVLSDIMGDEDYLGDMDFKVAGTRDGVTALQMDIKINGINQKIMKQALEQAKEGRMHILERMSQSISKTRSNISQYAPQIVSFIIPKDKIGEVIGPGGKMIKEIIEKTKVKIDINDEGVVNVAAVSNESLQAAVAIINDITAVPEKGKIYKGKVMRIMDYGAFVNFVGKSEGLVHVSEMASFRVRNPGSLVKEGDTVQVKVIDIDNNGKVKLSMKGLNPDLEEENPEGADSTHPSEVRESREDDRRRRHDHGNRDRQRKKFKHHSSLDNRDDRERREEGERREGGDKRDREIREGNVKKRRFF